MRIVLLDIIRSAAIAMILAAHIGQTLGSPVGNFFGIPNFYYVSIGGVAVTVFLILSGVVMELQYSEKNMQYRYFLVNRFRRIYPVYYMSLLGGILVVIVRSLHEGNFDVLKSYLNMFDILCSLTGFYAFAGRWGGPFLDTSWFLGLIMTMYCLFPVLSGKMRSCPHVTITILLLVSVLCRIVLGEHAILPNRSLDWFPLCRVFEFALGIYLAVVVKDRVWLSLNDFGVGKSLFRFISELSFPFFLIHYPLLFIIRYLSKAGVPGFTVIAVYLGVSLLCSWGVLMINKLIPQSIVRRNGANTG